MASTTIVWTALPAGTSGRLARISLIASPRLDSEGDPGVLASFPLFADWPAVVGGAQYTPRFGDGSTAEATRVDPPDGLDSALWAALFRPELRVRPPVPTDRTGNAVFSYPVQALQQTLRSSYGRVGVLSPFSAPSQRTLGGLLQRRRFEETGGYLDFLVDPQAEAAAREDMRQHPPVPVRPGGGAAARFWAFHHQPLPEAFLDLDGADAPDFADYVDVHQALAALQSYPALLRALGLVIDLEVPADALPPGTGTITVDVDCLPAGLTSVAMATAYARTADSFAAGPDPAAAGPARELVEAGYVVLAPDVFGSVHVDVEGGVFKGQQLLTSLLAATADGSPRDEAALPALRSAGISLVRGDRAGILSALFDRAKALEAGLPGPGTVFLEDVIRGFRLDVWDDLTGTWHGLLGRDGTYTVPAPDGGELTRRFVDEAAIEPAVTTTAAKPGVAPPADADLYLHEAIARWDGWSLAAPRPGRPVNRSADPTLAAEDDDTAGRAPTGVPLTTSFRPALAAVPTGSPPGDGAGSLPQLRFGRRYRLRLRAVDLAGNSPPVTDTGEAHVLPADGATAYLRYEPVSAPAVVLRTELPLASAGETLERVVLRSANTDPSLDEAVTAAPVERHVAPPRTSVQGAELHGALDDPATGRLRGDAAMFAEIAARDGAQLSGGDVPVAPQEQLVPPWLPDPLARGVALRDLPGVPAETESLATAGGAVVPAPFPRSFVEQAVEPRFPVERVVRVPFDQTAWPAVPAFRLVCVDPGAVDPAATGVPLPSWDAGTRALTVALPKATTATVPVSSYVEVDDLPLLGVWAWIREALQELSEQVGGLPDGAGELEVLGLDAQVLVERARTGGHWMITPARALTLVHAVQQPLGRPRLELQSARRDPDENAARLAGRLHVHGASTLQVDLLATWSDRVNDSGSATGYRDVPVHGAVEQFRIEDPTVAGPVFAGGSPPRAVGRYDPVGDIVDFGRGSPVHHLGDTRHHVVRYSATSTSRFRQHFDADAVVTRTSDEVLLSVPSSARPPAPAPTYVVPTFGWQRSTATAVRSSIRHGGGLRVYLDSSWWGSGEGELLAVVLWPASVAVPPDNPTRGRMGAFVTGWGMDPVWPAGGVNADPVIGDFLEAAASGSGVPLPELAAAGGPVGVDVVGHAVSWDAERGLWYADVVVQTGMAYFPFLRMGLARWQPASISGAALSRVVLADVAQLAPDRSVLVTVDPWSPGTARVTVSGPGYQLAEEFLFRPQTPVVTVEIQTRVDGIDDDVLAWTAADPLQASVVPDGVAGAGTNLLWRGTVTLPADREPGTYRLLVTETETWFGDPDPLIVHRPTRVPRIVYAEHMPL